MTDNTTKQSYNDNKYLPTKEKKRIKLKLKQETKKETVYPVPATTINRIFEIFFIFAFSSLGASPTISTNEFRLSANAAVGSSCYMNTNGRLDGTTESVAQAQEPVQWKYFL